MEAPHALADRWRRRVADQVRPPLTHLSTAGSRCGDPGLLAIRRPENKDDLLKDIEQALAKQPKAIKPGVMQTMCDGWRPA
jgi:hypothetical protein